MSRRRSALRVLHVDSGQEWQSVRDQVRLLVDGLRDERGIRQAVATLESSRLATECEAIGVPVIPVPRTVGSDPRALQSLARHVRSAWDIFHAHDGMALTMLLYLQALDGSNRPLIASRRYSAVPSSPSRWRRVELVLASTRLARDGLVRGGVEPHRIVVVPNAVDFAIVSRRRTGELREAIGARSSHRLVGSFTALTRNRDHATLLRAARELRDRSPQTRFAVLGRGPQRVGLEDLVAGLGLEGRVCLPGYLPDARRYMGDLDVFVMPSFDEELTSACLEAMAAGVPVVMPSVGPASGYGTPGPVRVPPGDPEAMADAIERLVEDEGAHRRAAEEGREFARRHTASGLVSRTVAAYRRVARGRLAA